MKLNVDIDMDFIEKRLNIIAMETDSAIYNIDKNELGSAGIKMHRAIEARNDLWKHLVEDSTVD